MKEKNKKTALYICITIILIIEVVRLALYIKDNYVLKNNNTQEDNEVELDTLPENYDYTKETTEKVAKYLIKNIEDIAKNVGNVHYDKTKTAVITKEDLKSIENYSKLQKALDNFGDCNYYIIAKIPRDTTRDTNTNYQVNLKCTGKREYETENFDDSYINYKQKDYSDYNYTDVKTFKKSKNNDKEEYYKEFHGVNIKNDGSICKMAQDDNKCYDISSERLFFERTLLYANYIFANNNSNYYSSYDIKYIIDRNGYLYEGYISLYTSLVEDIYYNKKVIKIGNNEDNQKIFVFENGTTLEFEAEDSIELSELYTE